MNDGWVRELGAVCPDAHRCLDEEELVRLAAGLIPPHEAEALLYEIEACAQCRALLAEAGVALTGNPQPTTLTMGTVIADRYEILRLIGRGGMGDVYEALDRELAESVALKTIRNEFCDDPLVIRRFKQELRLARKVVHPNVCRVFDLGTSASCTGRVTYHHTMELVRGQVLSKWARSGPAQLEGVLSVARQLAAGLAAIHAHGIIHRDLKPENVMVGQASEFWVKILDFGIARTVERSDGLVTTGLGVRLGTPDYMAPEQLAGRSSSTASDVYSFGLMVYELLTGAHPCPHPGTRATLSALNELRPTAPDRLRPEVPANLSRLVLDCLENDPLNRPATGAVLVRQLAASNANATAC